MARSIGEAVQLAGTDYECFVIGGGMVYAQFLPVAGKLYLTQVHGSFEADTFFPEIDFSQWKEGYSEKVEEGEQNQFGHTYTEFTRA
jgi:dihydrofolate reductase